MEGIYGEIKEVENLEEYLSLLAMFALYASLKLCYIYFSNTFFSLKAFNMGKKGGRVKDDGETSRLDKGFQYGQKSGRVKDDSETSRLVKTSTN